MPERQPIYLALKTTLTKLIFHAGPRLVILRGILRPEPERTLTKLRLTRLLCLRLCPSPVAIGRYQISRVHPGDGAGAQIQGALATYVFSLEKGFVYIHHPLKQIEHARSSEDVTRWNSFLKWPNVWEGGRQYNLDSRMSLIKCLFLFRPTDTFHSSYIRTLADTNPTMYSRQTVNILRLLHSTKSASNENAPTTIRVHVRRGDVSPDSFAWRYTSNAALTRRIQRVCSQFPAAVVEIFTNGNKLELEDFIDNGWHVDDYSDPICVFQKLVQADVLLTAKSSFSYIAAIFNRGLVIYEDFWHPPLPGWHELKSSGLVAIRAKPKPQADKFEN